MTLADLTAKARDLAAFLDDLQRQGMTASTMTATADALSLTVAQLRDRLAAHRGD